MKTIQLSIEQAKEMFGKDEVMDKLLLDNFPELHNPKLPKKYEDLEKISGCIINTDSSILAGCMYNANNNNYNLFRTFKEAESAIAKAKLSQLMAVYIGDWVPDWSDGNQDKWCIERMGMILNVDCRRISYEYLSFPTCELAELFLQNFKEDISKLVEL